MTDFDFKSLAIENLPPCPNGYGCRLEALLQGLQKQVLYQQEIEARLRASEQNLTKAQRIAHLASWEWDMVSDQLSCSPELFSIFGIEPNVELKNGQLIRRVHPEDRDGFIAAIRTSVALGSHEWENRIIRSDGDIRIIQASTEVSFGDDGSPLRMFGIAQDVTENRRAQHALRESEELLRAVLDALPVGVWIADPGGEIRQANRAGREIWGGVRYVGIEQYGDYKGWRLDTGEPIKADEWALAQAIKTRKPYIGQEARIQCFDGSTKYIRTSGAPVEDEDGTLVAAIVVAQDISNAVHAEGELRRLTLHLNTVREEERATIARELLDGIGQTLAGIRLQLAVTTGRIREPETLQALRGIEDSLLTVAGTMRRMAGDLRPSVLDHFGLFSAVESELRVFEENAGIRTTILRAGDDSCVDPRIATDMFRMLQEALQNVARHSGASRVVADLAVDPGLLSMRVADDGRGFDTSRPVKEGYGLLSIRERVRQHGGTFRIKSERTGTELIFSVPLGKANPQPTAHTTPRQPQRQRG